MNVRKRGLALLMCICMIFTLLPFSALADATAQDVVYGRYGANGWEQLTGEANKSTTSYNDGALQLTKEATPTGNKNEYKIKLQVVTTQTSTTTAGDAATVLVIDVSGSMDGGRLNNAKTAAKNFIDKFKSTKAERWVSVVAFNNNSRLAVDWMNVSNNDGYKDVIKEINKLSADGGTNLDAGLKLATNQFSKNAVSKITAKNVIALTDGMPTCYGNGIEKHGNEGCPITNDNTKNSADTLKGTAALYTVCYGAANDKCWKDWKYSDYDGYYYHYYSILGFNTCNDSRHAVDGPKVGEFLEESIATAATAGKQYAYNATTSDELLKAFENITSTITSGISAGTVTDGLPDGVTFVGDAPEGFTPNSDGTYNWELKPENADKNTVGDKTTYTYTIEYTVSLDTTGANFNEGIYHALNTATTFKTGDDTYNFNVPGVKGKVPTYTVTYNKGEHGNLTGQDSDGNVVHKEIKRHSPTPAAPDVTPDEGYYFIGWDSEIAKTVTETVTYTAQYAKKIAVTFTGESGEKVYKGSEWELNGITVTGLPEGYTYEGLTYSASGTDVGSYDGVFSGNVVIRDAKNNDVTQNFTITKTPGKLTITPITDEVTVKITGNTKTVTYNGTEQSVTGYTTDVGTKPITVTLKEGSKAEAKGTDVHKYMMGLTEEDFNVTSENYSNIKVVVVDGYLDITPIMDEVTVNITGNNKTVTYNGKEQSVEGYVADTNGLPITVSLATGKTAFANGTEVGTYKMNLAATDFVATSDIYGNIKIVIVEDGWLKINRRPMPPVNPGIGDEIIVEITGSSDSVVYDGTEHSVKGYTVKISDPRYTEADFTFTGKAEASGVNAGTYEMGLKAEQFRNTNARFTNVKFVIKADGVLTITPKELTITAGSKTEYGPTPVTCDEWTVSGLAAGDKVESVKITGIQSVPGSSPNVPSDAVIKNAKGADVTKNYAIKYVNGTLTMLEVLNKEDHFNYIIGTPEGLSLPTANVTRAEVATIFFRLMTDDARAKFDSLDNSFSDVAKGKWYNRAISTLAKAGIIKGDPAGTYRPGDPITRAEMAAIIARFGDFKEGGKTFSDISGHWAQKYIELAASNGWINGNPDGTFKPNNNITRAETVAMINRVLNRQTESNDDLLPVSQMTNWSDNMDTAKWYYRDMQEATNNHKAERVGDSMYEKWTEKLPDIDWASYQI